MKTILVPLDGSALAERTLPYVRMLAPMFGATIHLLRVIADEEKNALLAGDGAALYEAGATDATISARKIRAWDVLRYRAEGYLQAQAVSLRTDELDTQIHVQIGAPAETIVEFAEQSHADLIVMATHGYTGFKRWTLGSVTDKVVQASSTPVFAVPGSMVAPAEEPKLKRIMLTLDGSAFAKQALPLAAELANCACAELILMEAVATTIEVYRGALLPADVHIALRNQALKQLQALAGELRPYAIPVRTAVEAGAAAEQIVAAAARHQVDLIVMATHGRSGVTRWALGSVTDKVLHTTTTPLVLVRAQAGAI